MPIVYNQPDIKQTRRALRRNIPKAESLLWHHLRNRGLKGYKFRRQYSVTRYIIDFYCAKTRLAIELDGDSHYSDEAIEYDRIRQNTIEACEIKVLRFTNEEIYKNLDEVLERIALELTRSSTSP